MTTLAAALAARIAESGPITFADYMRSALYDPELGYYAAGPQRTGRHGHYMTAPELDPAFGHLWAGGFEQVWAACGRPRPFVLVEIGPGEGGFAHAVVDAARGAFADALDYVVVEPFAAAAARQRARLGRRVRWAPSLADVESAHCVFANEVLDNLPVHLVERRGHDLLEVWVTADGPDLVEVLRPAGSDVHGLVTACRLDIPHGHRAEIGLEAHLLVAQAATLVPSGAVLFVDYGADAAALSRRASGTLACYSDTGVDSYPLARPGDKDITAHVNWTVVSVALASAGHETFGPVPQRRVLEALGLAGLHDRLRAEFGAAAAAGRGADAVRALSRRQALGALADSGGLGALEVIAGARDVDAPPWLRSATGGP